MALHTSLNTHALVAPRSLFAVAIPATVGYGVAGWLVWSLSGNGWLGAMVAVVLMAATALVASRLGKGGLLAYLTGTAATILGLYVAIAVVGELWLRGLSG
jgi:hypothetical protein